MDIPFRYCFTGAVAVFLQGCFYMSQSGPFFVVTDLRLKKPSQRSVHGVRKPTVFLLGAGAGRGCKANLDTVLEAVCWLMLAATDDNVPIDAVELDAGAAMQAQENVAHE